MWASRLPLGGFDAVLCTHPVLWPQAAAVDTAQSICDLYHPDHDRSWRAVEGNIARHCSIVTVASPEDQYLLRGVDCTVLQLPEALDLSYFAKEPVHAAVDAQLPRVVLHGDLNDRLNQRQFDWFTKRIWPRIKRAVPNAKLKLTGPMRSRNPLAPLRSASLVVEPDVEPARVRIPVLQAMELCRPVVVTDSAVYDLHARHKEHLLFIRHP